MLISSFFERLTSSPSRHTKKLKMAEEENIASSSRLKKSKLLKDVKNSSNLWRSSCIPAHQFDFSNTINDPIKVEEVEDPSESSEQGSTFGEKASTRMIHEILVVHLIRQRW